MAKKGMIKLSRSIAMDQDRLGTRSKLDEDRGCEDKPIKKYWQQLKADFGTLVLIVPRAKTGWNYVTIG